ncbi:DUF624 domain-containing protein [Metabacillus malikii]|uniref:Membrane protein YesL n=1 Tax=Metabacillus malikii TaxID=1504265 RepID=A0ABT9ZCP3_9BACI|nr:DUF624 domain-containing protein [Metabacillus malikii]MDQ0229612.1 putative membrane protein YesL [Metabacillus malikii]
MNNKIVMFFQYLYKYFQVSLYFWLYLLKGIFIYSLVPAVSALFIVLRDINSGYDEEQGNKINELFKRYYNLYKHHRLVSFIYTILIIILYTGLFFINKQGDSPVTLLLTILFIYFLALTLLMLIYSTVLLSFKSLEIKNANMVAFVSIIKNIVSTVAVIVVIVIMYFIADYNFAIFVIFGPFLFGLGVMYSLYKIIEE